MLNFEERLTEFLPPTSCTPDMKRKVKALAKKHKVSLAAIQRSALSLFLDKNYCETIENSSETIEGESS